MIKYLLSTESELINILNQNGLTAVCIAILLKKFDIADYLIEMQRISHYKI